MNTVKLIEDIVSPHFELNIEDFYGDRGSCIYPTIEEMHTLFFKLNGKHFRKLISKNERLKLADKVRDLNIGEVELSSIPSFGCYIVVTLNK